MFLDFTLCLHALSECTRRLHALVDDVDLELDDIDHVDLQINKKNQQIISVAAVKQTVLTPKVHSDLACCLDTCSKIGLPCFIRGMLSQQIMLSCSLCQGVEQRGFDGAA